MFAAWRAYQHEHHDRDRLQAEIAPIQTELRQLLEDAGRKSQRTRWHRRFANNLLKVWPALWTFTTIAGVEPTNNPAERALRGPVIHRKLSLGTHSDDGERFAERALSAAATCRLQRRSLFDLPQRTDHRPHPRRPIPRARLSPGTERLRNLSAGRPRLKSWCPWFESGFRHWRTALLSRAFFVATTRVVRTPRALQLIVTINRPFDDRVEQAADGQQQRSDALAERPARRAASRARAGWRRTRRAGRRTQE